MNVVADGPANEFDDDQVREASAEEAQHDRWGTKDARTALADLSGLAVAVTVALSLHTDFQHQHQPSVLLLRRNDVHDENHANVPPEISVSNYSLDGLVTLIDVAVPILPTFPIAVPRLQYTTPVLLIWQQVQPYDILRHGQLKFVPMEMNISNLDVQLGN